jgi:hypothetical protein
MNIEQMRAEFESWAIKERIAYRDEQHEVCFYNGQRHVYWIGYQAGRADLQSQDLEGAAQAEWMVDDGRAPWAINSLKYRIKEMRASEKRCRNAFRKDYMRVVSVYFADALGEAAEALEKRLYAIDHARRIES